MSGDRLFQRMDAATGNERRPTVAIDYCVGTCSGVMRMSADDDDQTDQQHQLDLWSRKTRG